MFHVVLPDPFRVGLWNLGLAAAVALIGIAVSPLLRRWRPAFTTVARRYWSAYAIVVLGMALSASGFLALGFGWNPTIANVLAVLGVICKLLGLVLVVAFLSKLSRA